MRSHYKQSRLPREERAKPHGNYEVPTGESQTIPGQARTIKELIERLELGVPLPDKGTMYMDTPLEKIDKFMQQALDLTDLDDLTDRIQSTKDYIRHAIAERDAAKKREIQEEAIKQRKLDIEEAIKDAQKTAK